MNTVVIIGDFEEPVCKKQRLDNCESLEEGSAGTTCTLTSADNSAPSPVDKDVTVAVVSASTGTTLTSADKSASSLVEKNVTVVPAATGTTLSSADNITGVAPVDKDVTGGISASTGTTLSSAENSAGSTPVDKDIIVTGVSASTGNTSVDNDAESPVDKSEVSTPTDTGSQDSNGSDSGIASNSSTVSEKLLPESQDDGSVDATVLENTDQAAKFWQSLSTDQRYDLHKSLSSEERDALMKSIPESERWKGAVYDIDEVLRGKYKTQQRSNLDYNDLWSHNGTNRKTGLPKNLARRTLVEQELGNRSALATNMSIDWADGEEFKQYDLLFALNLRKVSGGAKLADVIIDQLLPNADKRHLESILTAREDKIMIILDIIDDSQEVVRKGEIAELIKGKYLPNATVIVNSMTTGGCDLIGEFADQHYIHRPKSGAA
ncbi:uncharacterized protein LOC144451707 [Glandiceps talaboti]